MNNVGQVTTNNYTISHNKLNVGKNRPSLVLLVTWQLLQLWLLNRQNWS